MTLQEYYSVIDYTYWHYVKHLDKIHGPVQFNYFTPELNEVGRESGLFAHHKPAYYRAGLSSGNFVINPRYGKYQNAYNLSWCDWVEHLYAHILILEDPEAENKDPSSVVYNLIPDLFVFFEMGMHPYKSEMGDINHTYYDNISDEDSYQVFKLLVERYLGQYSLRQLNTFVENKIRMEGETKTRMPLFARMAWCRSEDDVIREYYLTQGPQYVFTVLHDMNDKPSAEPKRSVQNIIDRAKYLKII